MMKKLNAPELGDCRGEFLDICIEIGDQGAFVERILVFVGADFGGRARMASVG